MIVKTEFGTTALRVTLVFSNFDPLNRHAEKKFGVQKEKNGALLKD
jgi:hypothetical protein